jgi:GTP-binding protein
MNSIKSAKFVVSSSNLSQCPKSALSEYAFIGRSNVGKSSLINYLTNNSNLSKVSKVPGKTKLINHFLINNSVHFVDLPGYGYAKYSKEDRDSWNDFLVEYITKRENLKQLFILVDSSIPPQKIDLEFATWVFSHQVSFSIIFTKTDKENQATTMKNSNSFVKDLKSTLAEMFDEQELLELKNLKTFYISSNKKQGAEKLIESL